MAGGEACSETTPFYKIPQAKKHRLTEREKGKIEGLIEAGMSKRSITRSIGRSPDTVCRPLAPKPPPKARKKDKHPNCSGAPPALMYRELRWLVRTAAKGDYSAAQLKADLQLDVHVRTIKRTLSRVDWLIFTKMVNTQGAGW
ncbi:unnamed protein product [Phytophthora fragariaefolia]|uniref:Unnamed protein product n=1 Tax=Phytophthora fragariaefolia TaxID=1490495 RepID=A0A9W6Y6L6_9STRA|nr:unnamed protein product [Phytophthora fragariaefolia]